MAKSLFTNKEWEDWMTYYTDARGVRVGDWYRQEYPNDELGWRVNGAINFAQLYMLMKKGVPFYQIIGVEDSVVRERVFEALAEVFNLSYRQIYNMMF